MSWPVPRGRPLLAAGVAIVAAACVLAQPRPAGRMGPVRLDGRAMVDDGGPFLPLGATLFWALWGERHDPARLDTNLAWLADRGVDYVRILGMVGGDTWADRTIDPRSDDYWQTVDRLLDRLGRHGLRVQATLFAEADAMMPERDRRAGFADRWAALANARPERIILLEVANEHWQNGVADVAELRTLGSRLADRARTLVALSAPLPDQVCAVYAGSAADVATIHYGRTPDRSDDHWQPVRQPWVWPDATVPCRAQLPPLVNNEPIGPQSSVDADDDPLRLAMGFATTFMAGNAAYVLHAGAGVRGGGADDRARGRAADFADTPRLAEALEAIKRVRTYLPADLANWTRHDENDDGHPFRGFDRAVRDNGLTAAYAATNGDRFVVAVLGMQSPVRVSAARDLETEVRDPLTGSVRSRHQLETGATLTLEGGGALILTGRHR